MEKIYNVYLASSIFDERDLMYNEWLAKEIEKRWPNIKLYVPHRNAAINDKTKCADSTMIFDGDYNRLKNTDVLIVCIDGDVIPSGSSCEIGLFGEMCMHDKNKFILGLCTDSRDGSKTHSIEKDELLASGPCESQYSYFNLFTCGCIIKNGALFSSSTELLNYINYRFNNNNEDLILKKDSFRDSIFKYE